MQKFDDTGAAGLSQSLADAALAYTSPDPVRSATQSAPSSTNNTAVTKSPFITAVPPSLSIKRDSTHAAHTIDSRLEVQASLPSSNLPSLLSYVDHTLMREQHRHNHPPYAGQRCVSCNVQWDNVSIPSTFLPLSPCNHWIHYRCLIWLATRDNLQKDKCPVCRERLFEWDGINALTLATRTSLPMDEKFIAVNPQTQTWASSNRVVYEQECQFLEKLIGQHISARSGKRYSDGSSDLVQCFNDVLHELRLLQRPQASWLRWNTITGSLLFGILVAVKMRRYMVERHPGIQKSEAWVYWEAGCKSLQDQLLDDLHNK